MCEGGDWHIWAVRERAGLELSCVCILSCCFYASILKYFNLIQEIWLGKSCKLSLSTCWRGINKGGTFYQAMEDSRREVILGLVGKMGGVYGAGVVSYVVGRLVGYSLIVCEADGEKWVSGRPVPLQSVICCDQNKCGIIRGSSATVR